MGTDGVELGNAREGACISDFIHLLRETFARACQGAQSQVQGGGRNPGESDSGPAILGSLRRDAKVMLGMGKRLKTQ